MQRLLGPFLAILLLIVIPLAKGCFYIVNETEHVIVTRFGEVIGEPISTPGLKFKLPFIHTINRIEKRLLNWDGKPIEIPTKDKAYISVNTFARWRITDPKQFFLRLRDASSAESRLEDILGSETRNAIARHELIEIIRTDPKRKADVDESIQAAVANPEQSSTGVKFGTLPPISIGREAIELQMKNGATPKLKEFGIELLDVRFKRVNYNEDVLVRVYQRMISERLQIAERFRSEGEAEAARITGNRERTLNEIESESYRKVQELRGEADAEASRIYAKAYSSHEDAPEFYRFLKSLETLKLTVNQGTSLMLTTQGDLFKYLVGSGESPLIAPSVPAPADKSAPEPKAEPSQELKPLQETPHEAPALKEEPAPTPAPAPAPPEEAPAADEPTPSSE